MSLDASVGYLVSGQEDKRFQAPEIRRVRRKIPLRSRRNVGCIQDRLVSLLHCLQSRYDPSGFQGSGVRLGRKGMEKGADPWGDVLPTALFPHAQARNFSRLILDGRQLNAILRLPERGGGER